MFRTGRSPNPIIFNKKDGQRGLTALRNYLVNPQLHGDAIPLCLRQEQTRSDFSETSGVSPAENALSFGFFSGNLSERSSSDIGAAQGKERGTGLLLSCDSVWALLSHRRLF